jgi:GNAT superfamily N-acetyltransferase
MRNELTIRMMMIRRATPEELPTLIALAWASFEAKIVPLTGNEGIAEYRRFCSADATQARMKTGNSFWLGEIDGEACAMAETRDGSHLVMLFVQPNSLGRGYGKAMLEAVLKAEQQAHGSSGAWTVSSSPNAVGFYAAAGFAPTGPEQIKNGLRFLPMRLAEG